MTTQEFSDQFDLLYNNITSNQAPGLNEYEKSVFLTKAQDEIVKAYFSPELNKSQKGFDGNPKRQIDFSMLIKTIVASEVTGITSLYPLGHNKFFCVPDNIMMFINESLSVQRSGTTTYLTVVPLAYDEYTRLMGKPYKRPLKNQAWRLITNTHVNTASTVTYYGNIASMLEDKLNNVSYSTLYSLINDKTLAFVANGAVYNLTVGGKKLDETGALETSGKTIVSFTSAEKEDYSAFIGRALNSSDAVVELIPGPIDTISTYTVRYLKRPQAIILSELEGTTIEGKSSTQECELDPILHQEILQRAVELAKASYTGDLNSQLSLGINSETNMGMVTSNRQ
jgi:hypothetical protein